MAGIIEEQLKLFESEIVDDMGGVRDSAEGSAETEEVIDEEELLVYESYKANQMPFEIVFPLVNAEGEYRLVVGGLTFFAKMQDLVPFDNMVADLNRRADYVGRKIEVCITDIDSGKGIISVAAVRREMSNADKKLIKRQELNAEMQRIVREAESKGESYSIPVVGIALKVHPGYVLMNIFNLNVLARVTIGDWTKGYIRDLSNFCEVGKKYKINLIDRRYMKNTWAFEWRAEHESYTTDPWEKVDTNIIVPGTTLSVECTQVDENLSRWWGVPVDNTVIPQRLELLGQYRANGGGIKPVVGGKYQCKVLNVNKDKRLLRIKIYREDRYPVAGGVILPGLDNRDTSKNDKTE